MPIRIPTKTVILQRNGKNFSPPIGKSFEFTAEEVKEIESLSKQVLRKPINESAAAQDPEQKQPAKTDADKTPAAAKTGGKTGGKTAADDL